jgi:hypothetical protein
MRKETWVRCESVLYSKGSKPEKISSFVFC